MRSCRLPVRRTPEIITHLKSNTGERSSIQLGADTRKSAHMIETDVSELQERAAHGDTDAIAELLEFTDERSDSEGVRRLDIGGESGNAETSRSTN